MRGTRHKPYSKFDLFLDLAIAFFNLYKFLITLSKIKKQLEARRNSMPVRRGSGTTEDVRRVMRKGRVKGGGG